jgi:hypothetical protein
MTGRWGKLHSEQSRNSYRLRAGRPGSDFWQGQRFLFSIKSRPPLGPTQPPVRLVPGALSLGEYWQERKTDHSPPASAELKNDGTIPPLPTRLTGASTAFTIFTRDIIRVIKTKKTRRRIIEEANDKVIQSVSFKA